MTVRTIGRRNDRARLPLIAVAMALAVPAAAQETQSPAPTPAPPSTFRLPPAGDGRTPGVQGPSDGALPPLAPGERGGPPTPAPTPAPTPEPATTAPPSVVTTRPAPTTTTPAPAATTRRDAPAAAASPNTASAAPAAAAAAPAAAAGAGDTAPAPGFSADPTLPAPVTPAPETAAVGAPAGSSDGPPVWAWLLAGLAAAGAGLWYWRRRPLVAGELPVDLDEPIAPPPPEPKPQPLARAAEPAARPVPAAAPAVAAPRPPAAASPLVTRPVAERRARVSMALEVRGIRMTSDQLIVALTLNLVNEGAVAATGLMVRVALNQGSAMPEPVLARFYDGAGGSVLRDDIHLAAGAGEQIGTEVMLPRAMIEPLMIGGKPMLIPVLAFDVTYHWDGEGDAFGQCAGSFVLGREQGTSGSERLAPLPLDRPNLIVNRPGARTTAVRRDQ